MELKWPPDISLRLCAVFLERALSALVDSKEALAFMESVFLRAFLFKQVIVF